MRLLSFAMGVSFLMGTGLAFFACGSLAIERNCRDIHPTEPPCDGCLWEKCCAQLAACDDDCVHCLRGGSTCSDTSNAVFKCLDKLCADECATQPLTAATTGAGGAGGAGGGMSTTTGGGGAGGK